MKKLSFYEQVGIVIPGAVFLFGLMFYIDELKEILAKNGMSVGGLGVFVLISYAAGHILAAIGNVIETSYWRLWGGMPSDWIVGKTNSGKHRLLSDHQIERVQTIAVARFEIQLPSMAETSPKEWFPVFRQIYSDVALHGKVTRADAFNGNYGLNRGLGSAAFALVITALVNKPSDWVVWGGFLVAAIAYLYRAHRFGVHYARETYTQFLLLPAAKPKSTRKVKRKGDEDDSSGKENAGHRSTCYGNVSDNRITRRPAPNYSGADSQR